ncbi:hypothetical protein NPIL_331361 [Nephila pilipes]|uniref:Uncharacterized protein n=1 Tax=Nephila pilipes TaxID=299642 RepID=A0A8X6TIN2_NEPPI|nr:hypothetical protein NPIL_331361 [Nephila pilipes]
MPISPRSLYPVSLVTEAAFRNDDSVRSCRHDVVTRSNERRNSDIRVRRKIHGGPTAGLLAIPVLNGELHPRNPRMFGDACS